MWNQVRVVWRLLLAMTLSRTVGLERPILARFPVPFLSRLRSQFRPSHEVVGLARGINFERGRGCVIGQNPIAGISTIEYG
jgi:hypothetical protein